jgi:hypothetical protein
VSSEYTAHNKHMYLQATARVGRIGESVALKSVTHDDPRSALAS